AQDGSLVWTNDIHGCCGSSPNGFGIDTTAGLLYTGHGITELDAETGVTVREVDVQTQGVLGFAISQLALYRVRGSEIQRIRRSDLTPQSTYSASAIDFPPAVIGEALLVTSSANNTLTRVLPSGLVVWTNSVPSPTLPVIAGTTLVIVGSGAAPSATLRAY